MELSSEEKFDRAMKLSQRTGVSLEDAKAALNACDFDMLDAVVYLEQLGKTAHHSIQVTLRSRIQVPRERRRMMKLK